MKRRSSAGGKPAKPRGPKRSTPKRRNAPNRGASVAGKETVVARLTRERDEALQQQNASSEVLNVISRSPGELQPVFDTILQEATRVCQANFGLMIRYEGAVPIRLLSQVCHRLMSSWLSAAAR